MGHILPLTEFFCYSLAMGIFGFSVFADTQQTGPGLIKLIAVISAGVLILGGLLHIYQRGYDNIQSGLYFISLCACGLTWRFHCEKKSLWLWGVYGVYIIAMLSLFGLQNPGLERFFLTLSSGLFLGIITYAMILGHWYLVTPKLSTAPLKRAFTVFWILLGIKLILGTYGVVTQGNVFGTGLNLLMPAVRVVWGYLAVGVMGYFGHRLVLMRSIQSATGILYAMTFLVFVGEIISNGLYYETGVLL